MRRSWAWSVPVALGSVLGCSGDDVGSTRRGVTAWCEAMVIGTGIVDVENDYIPNVVNCENGAASFEALKAQAVAARSYLYYRLNRTGDIGDGTGDQVYSCSHEAGDQHLAAAQETSGQVLMYQGTQVAAFYVAGARQDPPDCRGSTDDPTNTERYVTYNEGLSGDSITQTSLGLIDPDNHANRGCKSQNGADCLSDMGVGYEQILRFYYGADIELVTAEGPCVAPAQGRDAGTPAGDDAGTAAGGDAGLGPRDPLAGGCSAGSDDPAPAFVLLLLAIAAVGRRATATPAA